MSKEYHIHLYEKDDHWVASLDEWDCQSAESLLPELALLSLVQNMNIPNEVLLELT